MSKIKGRSTAIKNAHKTVELRLNYRVGRDEPARGIYRNAVVLPKYGRELVVAVRRKDVLQNTPYNAAIDGPPQINIAGSPRALEELGRFLVALARLETQNAEPYGWINSVRNQDGGTARVILRRVGS